MAGPLEIEAYLTVAGGLFATVVAYLVYFASPRSRAHQILALVLFVEGALWLLPQGIGSLWFGCSAATTSVCYAFQMAIHPAWVATGWLYALFAIYGVEWSPLKRLRRPATLIGIGVATVVAVILQNMVMAQAWAGNWITLGFMGVRDLPDFVKGASSLAVLLFAGLGIREARALGRSTARGWALFLAFGVRDAAWVIFSVIAYFPPLREYVVGAMGWSPLRYLLFGSYVLYPLLVGRAILLGRILDVHERLRIVVKRGTVGAVFVAIFVGVQTLVSEFVAEAAGFVTAGLATAALFLVLGPMQRFAERLAQSTVPSPVGDSDFYRQQVEIAYSDGLIGAKERKTLAAIRERIGLSAHDALSIEEAVATRAAPL